MRINTGGLRSLRVAEARYALTERRIYALHSRLAQIMTDAVHDGLIVKSPCSRRTAPSTGEQRVYVATTDQVWQLYKLFPARMRLAVVLGALVGLRLAEACGLRVAKTSTSSGRSAIPRSSTPPGR
jgi:integrase